MQIASIRAGLLVGRAIVFLSVALFQFCSLQRAFPQTPSYKVLVFSATAGFRHASIPDGIVAIRALGSNNNFSVDATEDATLFTDANLAQYKAVIFLSTTGDVLTNATQQAALQHFIEAGGGWVGIHSAADTHYSWAWYGGLVGAYFQSHPAVQQATVKVADRVDPSTSMLPKRWVRTDEWYDFQTNPRAKVHVLATLDESTYSGGVMGFDHPTAWCQNYDGGRAWYTGGGHTSTAYSEPLFVAHLLGGIQFAAGVKQADPGSTIDSNYQKVILDSSPVDPLELAIAPDGRVLYIERAGNVKIFKPQNSSIVIAGHINVETLIEDGLLGITLDNGFSTNGWLYLFYSPAGTNSEQHISRFTLVGDALDMISEKILLVVPTQRQECCHSAGSLFMHTNGDLYISAGDNTNPFDSSGFAPIDQQPGRSPWDSEKSASNCNDLRGKILRIHPLPDGTYSIPAGNLFPPGTPLTRPEIYVMGCRNPFRASVDESTGWLYWGEVGPDAGSDVSTRGPKGYDEWNQARTAGNYGWPYFVGNNKPYVAYDFATGISGAPFDPNAPVNTSPNNTGPTNLPPARSAWLWYPYDNSVEFPELNATGGRTAMGGPVYHYKTNVVKATKLPAYFDQTLLIWEWSRDYIKEVKIDDDGSPLKINPFLSSFQFNRPIDMKIGPDGVIYMIEWGTGFGGGNADAKIIRIDYVGGNHAPVAVASATPNNGSVPLTVQFSSAGTYDPDTNDVISFAWSYFGDGTTNSTAPNPSFTYNSPSNIQAQLTVYDNHGNSTVANVSVAAGNNKPVVTINQPPNGAIFDWGKSLSYSVSVSDLEDGSTSGGTIACSNLVIAPLLGHNDHSHGQGIFNACSGIFTTPLNTDSDSDNLFFVLNASYTDRGAPNVSPLATTTSYVFQPRHKQAEYCTPSPGLTTAPTLDAFGGGLDIVNITNGTYISLYPVNLSGITGITYRVTCNGLGGRIDARVDSPTGPIISTANVFFNGGAYTNLTAPLSNPSGTHTLYFVFTRNPGDANLFGVNWLEFQGPGLSLSSTPFAGIPNIPGTVQVENFDNGLDGVAYHDSDPTNNGGVFRSTGVDIEPTSDTGGGYDVGWTGAGEWLKYTVNVTAAGLHTISARIASTAAGGTFHIEFDGVDKTGPWILPNTGGWQTWQTLSISNVVLDAGVHVMRFVLDANDSSATVGNYNYFQFTRTLSNTPPVVSLTAPADQSTFAAPGPINVSASATDIDGSIAKVDFYASGFLIGTVTNLPYQVVWSNVLSGNYTLTARATDNIGNATTSVARGIRVIDGEAPFTGVALSVPGTIQAEDFDGGGEGVAFHDSDLSNNGGQYRNTAVDIESTGDVGGGYNVGWTAAGEYLKFTINALADGSYTLQSRIASSGDAGTFHIEIDGVNKTGPITNINTGGWQTYRTVTNTNIGLTPGLHTMRLVMDTTGPNGTVGNYNYFTLIGTRTNPPPALLHRYSFDEPTGSPIAFDTWAGTHGAIPANGAVFGDAFINGNGKLVFPGVNGFLDLPNSLVSILTNVTFEAWVTWNGGPNEQRIFDFGNNSNGEGNQGTGLTYLRLTPKSGSGVLRFSASTNSAAGEVPAQWTNALPTGQQFHIVVCYDFIAGTSMLYLNGQRVGAGLAMLPLNKIVDINVWLGRSNWPDPYFRGQFDEFRIYNGVLSDSAIAASFAAGPNASLGDRPRLRAATTGSAIQLSWPSDATGYALETSPSLPPIATWTPVPDAPALQYNNFVLTVQTTNTSQFFRLKK